MKKKSYCSALIPLKTTTSLRSSQISWGFPTSPGLQTHMARWFLTLHSAPIPQDSVKHGFSHFSFMHARWEGQSGSTKHSGWGAEKESVMQVRNLWTSCAVIFDWLSWNLYYALSKLNTLYTLFLVGLLSDSSQISNTLNQALWLWRTVFWFLTYVVCTSYVVIQCTHLDRYTLDCDSQPYSLL